MIDISDEGPNDHKRGLPRFRLYAYVRNSFLFGYELDIDTYPHELDKAAYFRLLDRELEQQGLRNYL